MTDYFALFGLPRRPGIDEEALKENYFRLAAERHPDAGGGDTAKFQELQEARQTLLDPAARLRHLMALEGVTSSIERKISPPAEVFLLVAGALDEAKKSTAKLGAARSGIARAALAGELRRAEGKLANAKALVENRQELRLQQIVDLDSVWPTEAPAILGELATELVFLGRWDKELRESLFRLSNVMDSPLR